MNPTPQVSQSQAAQVAQIASDTASEFIQAGLVGIALFSLIVTLTTLIVVGIVIWFLNKRSSSEQVVIEQQAAQNADLIIELREENRKAQASRDKQADATNRQADSNEGLITTMRDFLEKQSLQGDTLDRIDLNILNVVNGFGALGETVREIGKKVERNPDDHQLVLDALKDISQAQTKIFNLIDSRLPERAKTDTPAPIRAQLHPATEILRKRETDQVPKLDASKRPEDTPPPPDDKDKAS